MRTIIVNGKEIKVKRCVGAESYKVGRSEIYQDIVLIICSYCGKEKRARWTNVSNGIALLHRKCNGKLLAEQSREKHATDNFVSVIVNEIYNRLFHRVKHTKSKRLSVSLSKDDVRDIIFNNCFYCGVEPSRTYYTYPTKFNGIDRINSKLGYTKENSVACCIKCNHAKLELSLEEFNAWIDKIARFKGYIKPNDSPNKGALNLNGMKELKI